MKSKKLIALVLSAALTVTAAVISPAITSATSTSSEKSITATFPYEGQTVSVVKPHVTNYVNAMKAQATGIADDYVINDLNGDSVKISDYCRLEYNDGRSKEVMLAFDAQGFDPSADFVVKFADNEALVGAEEIAATNSYATVNNLYLDKTYYWRVEEKTTGIVSPISSFTTNDFVRMMTVDSGTYNLTNVRDFGGRMTESGKRVKQGIIFRGSELIAENYTNGGGTHYKNLDDTMLDVLKNQLGIAYEVDLRGAAEANEITASPLGAGVSYMRVTNGGGGGYAALWNGTENNAQTDALNGNVKNKELLKRMFVEAFTNANEKHVYFHCWGGADRTGTIAFILGGLLGMSYTDLIMDYEFTSFAYNYRPHDETDPNGIYNFPKFIEAIKASPYYAEGKKLSAIMKDWMIGALGMTEKEVETLKNNLLE